ncbi:MAG: 50S ribosomal protein L9 [Bacteroidota bacterium]
MKVIVRKSTKDFKYKVKEIIEVKDGYAVNYLIPQQLVYPFSEANQKILEENLRQAASKAALIKKEAVATAAKIKKQVFTLGVKAGEKGNIFGSVTNLQIAKAIGDAIGIKVGHNQIEVKEPITEVKRHTITLKLHPEVQTDVTLEVKAV